MNQPLVSICIPVYNGESFLGETLASALAQTYTNTEIVVSDNASTDRTGEVVATAAAHAPNIRYERAGTNVGPVGNFNRCIDLARGTYIKILCADDLLYPDCLTRQVAAFEGEDGRAISLVSAARDIVDERSRVRLRPRPPVPSGRVSASDAVQRTVRSGTNLYGEPQSVLFRTADARAVGGFNPNYGFCLDLDLWFRLLTRGDLFRIPDALCAFRVSPNSWSTGLSGKQAAEYQRFLDDWKAQGSFGLTDDAIALGVRRAALNDRKRRLFYIWLSLTEFLRFGR
jgi:GT2 family glycosyltransferase